MLKLTTFYIQYNNKPYTYETSRIKQQEVWSLLSEHKNYII